MHYVFVLSFVLNLSPFCCCPFVCAQLVSVGVLSRRERLVTCFRPGSRQFSWQRRWKRSRETRCRSRHTSSESTHPDPQISAPETHALDYLKEGVEGEREIWSGDTVHVRKRALLVSSDTWKFSPSAMTDDHWREF